MLLIPGVLATTTNFVEHPELVRRRLAEAVSDVGDYERGSPGPIAANLFTLVSDTMPRVAVASAVGLGGGVSAIAGAFSAAVVGRVLDATGNNYTVVFFPCTSVYVVATGSVSFRAVESGKYRPSTPALKLLPGQRGQSRSSAYAASAARWREHVRAFGIGIVESFGVRHSRGSSVLLIQCSSVQASVDIGS